MILVVDVGNTHTVFGVFSMAEKLVESYRIQTNRSATSDELYCMLELCLQRNQYSLKNLSKIVLASVVPELDQEWRKLSALIVDYRSPWSFSVALKNPKQIGADRLANAEAALKYGTPIIVVDAGTATTFDIIEAVDKVPHYIGGMIAPGVGLGFTALVEKSSKLPMIPFTKIDEAPLIGYDTESALKSGVVHGFAKMVDGMVAAIQVERNYLKKMPVIATGGFSHLLKFSKLITQYEPNLTLEGLYAVAKKL